MWRTILAIGASMVLSFAFLAACNGDVVEDDIVDDDPVVTDDAVTDDAVTDDVVVDDDAAVLDDDEDAIIDDDDDAILDDDDEAVVEDDDDAIAVDDDDDAVVDDDDDAVAEDAIEVVLSSHQIDMDTEIEAGNVVFEVTNEGDVPHGIAIQDAVNDEDDENGENTAEIHAAVTVSPGETRELEVDLEAGEYVVFCPIGEHRDEEDMEEELTVE